MLQVRRRVAAFAERCALVTNGLRIEDAAIWRARPRLVFVCTGNICRSPYAGERARMLGMRAVSSGSDTQNGAAADPTGVRVAGRRGVDLSTHRTTRWQDLLLEPGDIVVAMQLKHVTGVMARARAAGCHVVTFSSFLDRFSSVDDPYGKPEAEFERVFDLIDSGLGSIATRMAKL